MALISDLEADRALQMLLADQIYVKDSDGEKHVLKIYANNERPNIDLDEDYLSVYINGVINSKTVPYGFFTGNIAMAIYCKNNENGTAKRNRVRLIQEQIERTMRRKTSEYLGYRYFYKFSSTPITPTTADTTTGYSTTILNIEWHT